MKLVNIDFRKNNLDPMRKNKGYGMEHSEMRLHQHSGFDNPCFFYTWSTKHILL